jgi:hypothetical protein
MPIYVYVDKEGNEIERLYPISNIPEQIELENGEIAIRKKYPSSFGVVWKGQLPTGEALQRKEKMTKANLAAGDRGRAYWRDRLKRKHTHMSDKELN